jgi:hypothetical protein
MRCGQRALQPLQIVEQFLLVLARQLRAVGVAIVAVTFFPRVEKDIRLRQLARRPGRPRWRLSKSHFHGIENIVTAMKSLRTLVRRIQRIAQRRVVLSFVLTSRHKFFHTQRRETDLNQAEDFSR